MKRFRGTAFVFSVAGVLTLAVSPAFGQEHGEAAGPNLFTGDLGNIFWSLLTFCAVIFVLGKFAWGPVLTALQKREQFIRDSLTQAKADRESAVAQLAEYERKLQAAREEASAIVEEGRRDADVVKSRIQQDARSEADAMIERAKREIGVARDTAVSDLYSLTANLATDVAGKIIAKELDAGAHEHLVTEAVEAMNRMDPSKN